MMEKEPQPQFLKKEKEPERITLPGQRPEVKESPIDRLRRFAREASADLKKAGVPLNEKGRVYMEDFKGVYQRKEIEGDRQWYKDLKGKWENEAVSKSGLSSMFSREKILRQKSLGEIWEMLATAILQKNLGDDYFVFRTSEYDDARNKVDSVVLDRKTGNTICALDQVETDYELKFGSARLEEKRLKILERNLDKGGADLKYGISLETNRGKPEVKKGPDYHIPLFYFAASEGKIKKALEAFSGGKVTPEEETLFKEFIDSLKEQVRSMKGQPLHPRLRGRLERLEKSMLE